jgi:arylsulfatase A-like enzyme
MKRSLYDSGLHVPMMVRLPTGEGAGTQRGELVSFVDLAPTILSVAGANIPDEMPGRDLFNAEASGERDFVFAALDRHDEVPDRMRAARDKRWKYIRNYQPEEPFFRPHRFRDVLPTMAELWRLNEANQLTAVQAQYFKPQRSSEELYDTFNDPEEVVNLAESPAHKSDLLRMRAVLDEHMKSTRDYSDVSEAEMVEDMWPGGEQPVTAAPVFEVIGAGLVINAPTEGSSIGYRLQGEATWSLYVSPIEIPEQPIEAKAIRYGYLESEVSIFRPN